MGFIDHLIPLMSDTVTVQPGISDWDGAFTASGASFAPQCHISGTVRRVRGENGVEMVSTHQVYLDDYYDLNTKDYRFTLPARYTPNTLLQAVAIRKAIDENGPEYEVVYLP